LLPRVGEPRSDKVAILEDGVEVAISDCVIALVCESRGAARFVQETIRDNWKCVANRYSGTCAKFITLARLSEYLEQVGIRVRSGTESKIWKSDKTSTSSTRKWTNALSMTIAEEPNLLT
jgi:hypothetical protein